MGGPDVRSTTMSSSTETTGATGSGPDRRGADAREARQVAEDARESRWQDPSFAKGLYLGRFDLGLVHPHPRPEPEDRERERSFLERPAHGLRGPRRRPRRARGPGARRRHPGAGRGGGVRDEDPDRVRRARADDDRVRAGPHARRLGASLDRCAALRAPVHRRPRAGEARGHRGAEAALPASLRPGRDLGVPPHRAGRRLGPGAHGEQRDPHRGRLGLPARRGRSCGRRTGSSPSSSSSWPGCPSTPVAVAGSPRSSSRATPRASRSNAATGSWDCAASRTGSPGCTASGSRQRTASGPRATACASR